MELKKLAYFFENDVQNHAEKLRVYLVDNNICASEALLSSTIQQLQFLLFNQVQKTLIAHYKGIEDLISYNEFANSLRGNSEVKTYFNERYPVMKRRISTLCAHWLEQTQNILARYALDKQNIAEEILKKPSAPAIQHISYGMGDSHRGGKSVCVITLTNGARLVYKPRSLSIDCHFRQLVDGVNQFAEMDLRLPHCLDKGEYGWVEFITHESCLSPQEVDNFYRRLGAYTCILYVLNGTDFHYENLIAHGEHPVLIDLESFFHPEIPNLGESKEDSVLMTGVIPTEVHLQDSVMPDISGMTDVEGTQGIFEAMVLVADGNGSYDFVRRKGHLEGAQNIPKLDGVKITLDVQHAAVFKQGFEHLYRAILSHLPQFKQSLECFRNDTIRVLLRFTACYSYLLTESDHPTVMTSEEVEYEHFNGLAISLKDNEIFQHTIKDEIADLKNLDVPLFTASADSRDLWLNSTRKIDQFFDRSGFELVLRKLAKLGSTDLNYQLWIIDNALSLNQNLHKSEPQPPERLATSHNSASALRKRVLHQASKVAEYLQSHLHEDESHASWMVVRSSSLDNKTLHFSPAALDLYAGMPGEILFLTCFGMNTHNQRYLDIAQKAYKTFENKIDDNLHKLDSLGLYYGWGGIIRTLTLLNKMTDEPCYLTQVDKILAEVDFDSLIEKDRRFGLIKGSAGLIIACAEHAIVTGSKDALRVARLAAAHLMQHRYLGKTGNSWRINSAQPLSGMAHGASGFAMAFAKLFEATQEQRYADAALGCIAYENTLFLAEHQNWQDCRDFVVAQCDGKPFSSVAWSHGAPGIGLARLALLQSGIRHDTLFEDLNIAINTTLKDGFNGNDSLIFGAFGNLELLISCYHYFPNDYESLLTEKTAQLLQRIESRGWDLGDKNVDSFGLMIGVTGVGYQCLRLLFNESAPSLLSCTK